MLTNLIIQRAFLYSKFILHNGKYLIPVSPKRPLSSYLIYSNQIREKVQQQIGTSKGVAQSSKIIGQKWKQLADEDKKKYEEKAAELKKQADKQKLFYEKKYEEPFKRWSVLKLIQSIVKQKKTENVGGLAGFQAKVKQYRESLSQEQIKELEKNVEKLNHQNTKNAEQYLVPKLEITSFNSFLHYLRKNNPNIPKKSEIDEVKLAKYQTDYENYKQQFNKKIKHFAALHSISLKQLTKILSKSSSPIEKITKELIQTKETTGAQIQKAKKKLNSIKDQKKKELQKFKKKQQKQLASKKKKLTLEEEKVRKSVEKLQNKVEVKSTKLKHNLEDIKLKKSIEKEANHNSKEEKKTPTIQTNQSSQKVSDQQ